MGDSKHVPQMTMKKIGHVRWDKCELWRQLFHSVMLSLLNNIYFLLSIKWN